MVAPCNRGLLQLRLRQAPDYLIMLISLYTCAGAEGRLVERVFKNCANILNKIDLHKF